MSISFRGAIPTKQTELNLDLTLLGGQSFRWQKLLPQDKPTEWRGVAYDAYWILTQTRDAVSFEVFPVKDESENYDTQHYQRLLAQYFRTNFDLEAQMMKWQAAHKHFAEVSTNRPVRVLRQEPLENILSFICSQNNHIKRISKMVNLLCSDYGRMIGTFNGEDAYAFPTLDALMRHQKTLECSLRDAKFGYRAKFIAQTVAQIAENGGASWFDKLRELPYKEARLELAKLQGIGFKVADCICLMSLDHLESVPIDTHIFKIAQSAYLPHLVGMKSVTPRVYDEITTHFQNVYGPYAGWAQAVLFCSELQQFQENIGNESARENGAKSESKAVKKKKRKLN